MRDVKCQHFHLPCLLDTIPHVMHSKRKKMSKPNNNSEEIPKKQKIVEKEDSVVDSGFQNINNDISKYILDNLKLAARDLQALSQTCSSWHNKIVTYYREILSHIAPFTYLTYKGRPKYQLIAQISDARAFVQDIQVFEFKDPTDKCTRLMTVPWCPHIVISKGCFGFSIIDLRRPDPVINFRHDTPNNTVFLDNPSPLISINSHRKQVVVHAKEKLSEEDNDNDGIFGTELFLVYNISEAGQVDLVKRIVGSSEDSSALHLRDDGSIWIAANDKVRVHHSDSDQIEQLDLKDTVVIREIIDMNGVVKIIVQKVGIFDLDNFSDIKIYDTKTKEFEVLPDIVCGSRGRVTMMDHDVRVHYHPNSLQIYGDQRLRGSVALDPIQKQISPSNEHIISPSPNGSQFIKLQPKNMTMRLRAFNVDTKQWTHKFKTKIEFDEPKMKLEGKNENIRVKQQAYKKEDAHKFPGKFKYPTQFVWLNDNAAVAIRNDKIAILDFSKRAPPTGYKAFRLPGLISNQKMPILTAYNVARISDNSFVVYCQRENSPLVVYKLTI